MACHKTKGTPARTTRKQAVGVDSSGWGGGKMVANSLHVDSESLYASFDDNVGQQNSEWRFLSYMERSTVSERRLQPSRLERQIRPVPKTIAVLRIRMVCVGRSTGDENWFPYKMKKSSINIVINKRSICPPVFTMIGKESTTIYYNIAIAISSQ